MSRDISGLDVIGLLILRRLYFSDCSMSNPHIGICDLAAHNCLGSAFPVPVRGVTSLIVNQRDQRVYWTDAKKGVISSASMGGDQIRLLRSVSAEGTFSASESSDFMERYKFTLLTYLLSV